MMTTAPTRVCFTLRIRPEMTDEYKRRHAAVWPPMLHALSAAGWMNYSLFLSDDGLLIGYLETDDFDAAKAAMADSEVNARWQAEMGPFFVEADGRPDENMHAVPMVFQLETQLAALSPTTDRKN